MSLGEFISDTWTRLQGELFPALANKVGPLNERRRHLVAVLDLVPVERFVHYDHGASGVRPATGTRWRGPSWRRRCGTSRPRAA